MDVPLVHFVGVPRQVRKWDLWYKFTLCASVATFGFLLVRENTHASQFWAPVQIRTPFGVKGQVQLPSIGKHASALAASRDKTPIAPPNSLPSAQQMGILDEEQSATSSSDDLLPYGALIGLFAAVVAAFKKAEKEEFVMLATGPQDAQDAEKGNGRLEIRLQALSQSTSGTTETVNEIDLQTLTQKTVEEIRLQTLSQGASGATETIAEGNESGESLSSNAIFLLPLLFTAFILQAYFYGSPVPPLLPRVVWLWLHCLGGMLFGGLVFSSTLYEALVILQGDPQVRHWWFKRVPDVDGKAMLPFLGLTFISGVSLAQLSYRSLARSPPFVSLTLEMLVLFGVMWALLDHNTQGPAKKQCDGDFAAWQRGEYSAPNELPGILKARLAVNAASCAFIPLLFWIMVTKPPYDLVSLLHF